MKKTVEQRVIEWVLSGDTGSSSKTIMAHMTGVEPDYPSYPHDPADLGRCLRLLDKIPEWKERMPEMAKYTDGWMAGWSKIIPRWDEVAQCMADEVGIDWSKGKSAPKTYALMREIYGD